MNKSDIASLKTVRNDTAEAALVVITGHRHAYEQYARVSRPSGMRDRSRHGHSKASRPESRHLRGAANREPSRCRRTEQTAGSARLSKEAFAMSAAQQSPCRLNMQPPGLNIYAAQSCMENARTCRGQGQTSRAWRETWPCPGSRLGPRPPTGA